MKNTAGKSSSLLLATLLAVALSACNSTQTKPESDAATATSATAEQAPAPAAKQVESKPVCKEEPAKSKTSKTSKTKTKTSKTAAAPVDCIPASAAAAAPVAAPASTAAVQTANASGNYNLSKNKPITDSTKVEAGQGTMVKGINDWEGEISGVPAANSRLTRLKIGMSQQQVADLAGQPTDQGAYVTGKAFIPFYFGSDRSRWEMVYKGQGRLIFSNQSGFGSGYYLTWIIHNANEGGYR